MTCWPRLRHGSSGGWGSWPTDLLLRRAQAVAVTAFADELDSIAILESLLDKSLIFRMTDGESGEPRFGLLETLRAFALEQLGSVDEEYLARQAHLEHFLVLAEAAADLRVPDSAVWMARLELAEDNLRLALNWALNGAHSDPTPAALGVQLAGALGHFWMYGNRSSEGGRWLDRCLEVIAVQSQPGAERGASIRYRARVERGGFHGLDQKRVSSGANLP